jgi:hypothetical protein
MLHVVMECAQDEGAGRRSLTLLQSIKACNMADSMLSCWEASRSVSWNPNSLACVAHSSHQLQGL